MKRLKIRILPYNVNLTLGSLKTIDGLLKPHARIVDGSRVEPLFLSEATRDFFSLKSVTVQMTANSTNAPKTNRKLPSR